MIKNILAITKLSLAVVWMGGSAWVSAIRGIREGVVFMIIGFFLLIVYSWIEKELRVSFLRDKRYYGLEE